MIAAPDFRLRELAHAVAERVHPELVLLFGSRARGTARHDSDVDLMIVVRDPELVESARRAAHEVLSAQSVWADVLACSVEDYTRRQHDPGCMDFMIAREGVVLYTTGSVPQRTADRVRESRPSEEGVALWLERAASDLRIAELSLASANPSIDAICFHAHAAVEKWLKALIVVHRQEFPPRTHDLDELLIMQPSQVSSSEAVARACTILMNVYPKSRYTNAPMPSASEATESVAAAHAVREVVLREVAR